MLVAGAVLAAAAILSAQLLVPPIVGLANNGDFEKVMGHAGLRYPTDRYEEKYFTHIVTKFSYSPAWDTTGYLTSETVLARLARDAARLFSPKRPFDLRVLGALHAALLVAAIGGLVAAAGGLTAAAQACAALLMVFVFTDVGYAAPLNSFYSQTASLLFLLLTAAVVAGALRGGRLQGWLLPVFFLCAAGFVGSKPQESLFGPPLALLALRLSPERPTRAARWTLGIGAAGLCLFSLWYYGRTPERAIRSVALYRTVFNELLTESPDPAADLSALGLDPRLENLAGKSAYGPDSPRADPDFQAEFGHGMSYTKILRFYLARPSRLSARLLRAAPGGVRLRPGALGNLEKSAPDYAPNRLSGRFAAWSGARETLMPVAHVWLAALIGGNLAAAAAGWRRAGPSGRRAREAIALLALMAVVEFLVSTLADSLESVHRHLFTFHAMCDLLLIADAVWLAQRGRAPRMASARREAMAR
ncbi:MAG: hypothetical protein WEB59_08255 [Thermoanaerobaculia bacterium]